ncbi:DMT family transporter [Caviibacterium pharyngocola]|uniref:EamA family transporter n=1 Tax=Caviibacterium pharyngocola TaxID=28159 RepID=A0A2M8RVR3_9PAST|nr:DMT family transporter [Caviibacterium pharyngocola]PJG82974.1 EamA family transporter [Caviibacterium pharyngocola]
MKQKPMLGFSLALLASAMWGALPIAVKQVLVAMDAQTLVWFRFMIAGLVLFIVLRLSGKLPKLTALSRRLKMFCVLGAIGLAVNFFLFSYALHYISPTTNQVLWQLAPFTMILCGVVIFREKFAIHQKIGFALLIIGLVAFFNDHFDEILQLGAYAYGIVIGAMAAVIWVLYGISQKMLSETFSSQQILCIIYLGCALLLTPFAQPTQFYALNGFALGCFIFCCLNTLIGYGAYGEALKHWEASKVSVVTILLPIFTMIFSIIGHNLYPNLFAAPDMNLLSYIGALIVVAGTILSAIGHKLIKNNNEETK